MHIFMAGHVYIIMYYSYMSMIPSFLHSFIFSFLLPAGCGFEPAAGTRNCEAEERSGHTPAGSWSEDKERGEGMVEEGGEVVIW